MSEIVLANALIAGLEILIPKIQAAFERGEVTAEEQQALVAKINSLRDPAKFTGPEWEVTP